MRFEKPTIESVSELLTMVLGEDLNTTDTDVSSLDEKYVATFIDDNDELVAICASDMPFASFSGASLAMIPADVAKESIKEGKLTQNLSECFYEIMNLCSKLMLSESSDHLRLDKAYAPDELPEGVTSIHADGESCAFEVDIPRYGKGKLDFYIAA